MRSWDQVSAFGLSLAHTEPKLNLRCLDFARRCSSLNSVRTLPPASRAADKMQSAAVFLSSKRVFAEPRRASFIFRDIVCLAGA